MTSFRAEEGGEVTSFVSTAPLINKRRNEFIVDFEIERFENGKTCSSVSIQYRLR